jgi:OOP family OmpA-OmpF porin
MRNLALIVALATTALAGPALARPAQAWYVGIDAGAIQAENQVFRITSTNGIATSNALTAKYDTGFDVDGNIGYDFGAFRAEFEVGYKNNKTNHINVNTGGLPALPFGNGTQSPPAGSYQSDGTSRILSFMTNGLVDFGGSQVGSIGGFVGGGVGVARVKQNNYAIVTGGNVFVNDSDTRFAWQLLAGVYKPLTPHVDLGLKYRFFNVQNVRTFAVTGAELDSRFRSHSLLVNLTYRFGQDAAPPPPPPPAPLPVAPTPAPLPPCPPAAVTPGPFLIFFDWDRSVITPEAAAILDRAAEQYASTGQTSVMLAGYADKSGKPDYNLALSQRRADAAKRYMAGKGVAEGVINTEAFGETHPLVETADGVREPQNRRVEITFGGAPAPQSAGPCTPQ